MNTENFKRVLDHIKAHPKTWKQSVFKCRTAYCFAGHAQIFDTGGFCEDTVADDAKEFLGISYFELLYLFNPKRTIADFEDILANGFPKSTQVQ